MCRGLPLTLLGAAIWLAAFNPPEGTAAEPGQRVIRPTMGEFIGVNGHTVLFKPDLYAQVCRKVRDYHSFEWDMGPDTDFVPRFPEARNRVNWNDVYGSWRVAGFETDVCVMFNNTPPDSWKDLPKDARAYGLAFARAFGPSSKQQLVSSVEIGNEPGKYSDKEYRELLRSMAMGLREGDPKLKIVTCNMTAGRSGDFDKSVDCVAGLSPLYDVLNIHTYALAERWPTWRRSFPEDPRTDFLKSVEALITWRDEHAKGKEIWVTEFGWDASTKPAPAEGDAAKWKGNVSDEVQARYLVRAFLLFAAMDVRRAYLYFFNDSDEPSFHAASGITRDYQPKASFHAVAHLYRSLRDFRFERCALRKNDEAYVWEFVHKDNAHKKVLVAWSPTGADRSVDFALPLEGARLVHAETMPLAAGEAPALQTRVETGSVQFKLGENPAYLWVED